MIQNKDNYVGEREPENKLRDGKGIYTYDNPFFQYEGDWKNGVKHGKGILRMNVSGGLNVARTNTSKADNSKFCQNLNIYEGDFVEGEMTGNGVYKYANGNIYTGQFLEGEKHGKGQFKSQKEEYTGEWQYNQYSGKGNLSKITKNGDKMTVTGQFLNHKPHGYCDIQYNETTFYKGNLQNGKKHGQGNFESDVFTYIGDYQEDLKQGNGVMHYKSGFKYEGDWEKDQPTLTANRLVVSQIKPVLTEQELQEQQQQNAKQKNPQSEEFQGVEYELNGKPFTLEVKSMYQPPQIEDPNQPSEEEIEEMIKNWQKENKKNKNPPPMPDFRAPRMIDPDMIPVIQESGRLIKLSLIFQYDPEKGKESEPRVEKEFQLDYREQIRKRKEEIQQILKEKEEQEQREKEEQLKAEQQQQQAGGGAAKGKKQPAKKPNPKQAAGNQEELDLKINLYNEEENQNQPLEVRNENGVLLIENLEYPENFPPSQGGNYYIRIEDITGDECYGQVESTKIDLIINPVGGGDPKKKKK